MPMKNFAIDAATGLIKRELGQAAVTSTAYIGTQWDQGGSAATDFVCVINLEAVNVASGSIYTFRLVGSNVADRSDAQVLDMLETGNATTVGAPETVVAAAGDQLIMRARSEKKNTQFRYIDLHLEIAGGSATITFGAYISKEF